MPYSFATPWTVARQASLSMGFPSKNTGVGCRCLLHGIFTIQGLNLSLLHWQADSLSLSHQGSPLNRCSAVLSRSVTSDSLRPHGLSPPGSSVHGILQARILEWVAMPSSRGSSQPRDRTQISRTVGEFFTVWLSGEPQITGVGSLSVLQQNFLTQEANQGFLHCKWILY